MSSRSGNELQLSCIRSCNSQMIACEVAVATPYLGFDPNTACNYFRSLPEVGGEAVRICCALYDPARNRAAEIFIEGFSP
jgi:hypothetical protein